LSSIETSTYQLPEGRTAIKIKTFMRESKNSRIQDYYDLGPRSVTVNAFAKLLKLIFTEPTFNILRTKEQLGYSVYVALHTKDNSNLLAIHLQHQENKHSSKSIAERVKKFFVENLSNENFYKIKENEIKRLRQGLLILSNEANYNFARITNNTHIFDEYEKQAVVLEGITKQNVIDFYTEKFIANKPRNLRIILVGNVEESEPNGDNEDLTLKLITEKYDEEEEVVSDLKAFQESLQLHPKYIPNY
jgi:secreted Zn-dependent insulinase-like peptidase